MDTPRHLFHYDAVSLENLMTQEGFKILMMQVNPLDYFQDLAFSVYGQRKTKNMMGLRAGTAILCSRSAEINTYITQP